MCEVPGPSPEASHSLHERLRILFLNLKEFCPCCSVLHTLGVSMALLFVPQSQESKLPACLPGFSGEGMARAAQRRTEKHLRGSLPAPTLPGVQEDIVGCSKARGGSPAIAHSGSVLHCSAEIGFAKSVGPDLQQLLTQGKKLGCCSVGLRQGAPPRFSPNR